MKLMCDYIRSIISEGANVTNKNHANFDKPTYINSKSNYGNAFQLKIKNCQFVVVKFDNDESFNWMIAHEATIGQKLNDIRKTVPNFVMVYGTLDCSPIVGNCDNISG